MVWLRFLVEISISMLMYVHKYVTRMCPLFRFGLLDFLCAYITNKYIYRAFEKGYETRDPPVGRDKTGQPDPC